jgi:CheY-like chemotaxis protein
MDRAASTRRRRITVIDDQDDFLELMTDVLSARHEVVAFSGHDLTPDDVVDSRPDLLVIDLRLARGDLQGLDIVRLARAHRDLQAVPILVCSGDPLALDGRAEALSSAGNTAMLLKPFSLEAVEQIVGRGLDGGYATPASHMNAGAAS